MKRPSYYLFLAVSEFSVHKKRFILTALSVAWGTCAILVLLAFGQGMRDSLVATIRRSGDNVLIVRGGRTGIPYRGMQSRRRIRLDETDVTYIRESIPRLRYVGGTYRNWSVPARVGTLEMNIEMTGSDAGYGEVMFLEPLVGGRYINTQDNREKRRVVALGSLIATNLFPHVRDPVGETVYVNNLPFTVIGVLEEKEFSMGWGGDPNMHTYIPATTYAALYGNLEFDRIVVSLHEDDDAQEMITKLREVLGTKHTFLPRDAAALRVWDTIERTRRLRLTLQGFQILLGCIGGITLMISGVGLANIMYASIMRRTREIGIKIAIGAVPSQIRRQIICETFFFGIAGGICGGVMAFVIVRVFSSVTLEHPMLRFFMNARLSLPVWIASVCVLVVITFLAGYFPARVASRQNPIESLRYE